MTLMTEASSYNTDTNDTNKVIVDNQDIFSFEVRLPSVAS